MGALIYSGITSFDGFTADRDGHFDWSAPDETVHAYVNDLERYVGLYLYGRRMYDVMQYWQTAGQGADDSPVERDFADIWRAAEKRVYSTTLAEPTTDRTQIERRFDAAEVARLVAHSERNVSIGGPTIAAHALHAGIVDELHQFVTPVIVGGGTPFLPQGLNARLELVDVHPFPNGVVHLHYRIAR